MRKLTLIGLISLAGIILIGIIFLANRPAPQGVSKWSKETILQTIAQERPSLVKDGQPVIKITDISMPEEGWYVVTIQSIHAKQNVPVRVLLYGKEGSLRVVLGPEVDFTDTILATVTLPDSVIIELQKS